MSVLSDSAIRRQLGIGGIRIDPEPEIVQPTSVDLRLGSTLIRSKGSRIFYPKRGIGPIDEPMPFEQYHLHPGTFVLGVTQEWIEVAPYLIAKLEGKSSLARLGLQIEAAGYIDPGWKGRLTLEIVNLGNDLIVLEPGMLICQIRFEDVVGICSRVYGDPELNSHYQGATGPQTARLMSLPKTALRDDAEPAAAASNPSS